MSKIEDIHDTFLNGPRTPTDWQHMQDDEQAAILADMEQKPMPRWVSFTRKLLGFVSER